MDRCWHACPAPRPPRRRPQRQCQRPGLLPDATVLQPHRGRSFRLERRQVTNSTPASAINGMHFTVSASGNPGACGKHHRGKSCSLWNTMPSTTARGIGRSRSVPCCAIGIRITACASTLTVTNRHTEPAPLGIGLHPYFARPPGVTLQFEAGGVWMNGEEPLPRQHASVPAEWDHSHARTVGDAQLDNCFTNWTRRVQISGLAAGITIEADDVFRHLQVYTPPDQDFFCVEPVSHVPNALNLRTFRPIRRCTSCNLERRCPDRLPSASALCVVKQEL